MTTNPLLLTLTLDPEAQAFFTAMRKQYFPPERNFLDAHLTLFHQLPTDEEHILEDLKTIARQQQPMVLEVTRLVSIGNGVAYKVESGNLQALHSQLQKQWQQWIIPQDKQKLWPHITIQNKVLPNVAKALITTLSENFAPFEITATGFTLWEYQGGPWKFVEAFKFTAGN